MKHKHIYNAPELRVIHIGPAHNIISGLSAGFMSGPGFSEGSGAAPGERFYQEWND